MFFGAFTKFGLVCMFLVALVFGYYVKVMADVIPAEREVKETRKKLFALYGYENFEQLAQNSTIEDSVVEDSVKTNTKTVLAADDFVEVVIGDQLIKAEVASTPEEKTRGLMERQNLGTNEGMLFVYDSEGLYAFWMKNTKIPLDMIWIDSEHKIVDIKRNAQPCTVLACPTHAPKTPALYILEVNGGWTETNSINPGEYVRFQLLDS